MNVNRRTFFTKAAVGTLAAMSIPAIVEAVIPADKKKKKGPSLIQSNDLILFQGDSITDAGRDRSISAPNVAQGLGNGYVFLLAAKLLNEFPAYNLSILNKGISGNKVFQLSDRWEKECLSIRPKVLSLLVGVNDFWHTKTHNYTGTPEIYKNDLLGLLRNTKKLMPEVRIVMGEPFALKGCSAVDDSWYPEFDKYRQAAKQVAEEMGAIWIPYQEVFDKALEFAPAPYWTHDGVHPSVAGCELMAQAWLNAVV